MKGRFNDLNHNKVAILGVKGEGSSLDNLLLKLINCNPKYIFLSFSKLSFNEKILKSLEKVNCPIIALIPFNYKFKNQREAINDMKFISCLNKIGVAYILNSLNGCNFILTDKLFYKGSSSLYYGDLNRNMLYEILNNRDLNYELWREEIFSLLREEILKYRNFDNMCLIYSSLRKVKENLDISLNNFSKKKEEVYFILENLGLVEDFLIKGTDTYIDFDRKFFDLIRENKRILNKIGIFKKDIMTMTLDDFYEEERLDLLNLKGFKKELKAFLEELDFLIEERIELFKKLEFLNRVSLSKNNINDDLVYTFKEEVLGD